MSHQFQYGAKSEDNKMLQQRLIDLGALPKLDSNGNPNDDGIFGTSTAKALGAFLGATGPVTVVDQATFNKLWPSLAPTESQNMIQNVLGGIFANLFGNLIKWDLIAGYIRTALIAWGTTYVTTGVITNNQLNDAVGAIIILLGFIWQLIQNNINHNAMQVVKAIDAHPAITVVPANQNASGKPIVQVTKAA